jgi:hypothetical protein
MSQDESRNVRPFERIRFAADAFACPKVSAIGDSRLESCRMVCLVLLTFPGNLACRRPRGNCDRGSFPPPAIQK